MIAVIGRVKDVGIFQLAERHQLAKNFLDSFVDALQRLEPFRHEQIGEAMVNGFHFAQPAEDPLLVWVGREIVARRSVSSHVEKHVRILGSGILGTVRRRETHHQMERLMVVVLFRLTQETNGIVGDQVGIIIRLVVGAVFDLSANYRHYYTRKMCTSCRAYYYNFLFAFPDGERKNKKFSSAFLNGSRRRRVGEPTRNQIF